MPWAQLWNFRHHVRSNDKHFHFYQMFQKSNKFEISSKNLLTNVYTYSFEFISKSWIEYYELARWKKYHEQKHFWYEFLWWMSWNELTLDKACLECALRMINVQHVWKIMPFSKLLDLRHIRTYVIIFIYYCITLVQICRRSTMYVN